MFLIYYIKQLVYNNTNKNTMTLNETIFFRSIEPKPVVAMKKIIKIIQ